MGVSLCRGLCPGGSLSRGSFPWGGLCPGVEGGWIETPLPVDRMTQASESLTFPCGCVIDPCYKVFLVFENSRSRNKLEIVAK